MRVALAQFGLPYSLVAQVGLYVHDGSVAVAVCHDLTVNVGIPSSGLHRRFAHHGR